MQIKTLLVGLDAACWEYLDPLIKTGRMPHLASLQAQGVYGRLRSVMPPITPAAWSSIVTGVNPGKHGVFEWAQKQSDSYASFPVNGMNRTGTPIWQRLNQAGIRTGLVNVPLTFPPSPVDGFLLCGFSTPPSERNLTYPAEMLQEIEARFGRYIPDILLSPEDHATPKMYQAERDLQSHQVRIAAHLAKEYQVQVLIMNLMLLDHANHTMPDYSRIEQALVDSDFDLGYLLDEFQPDNVLLISDHGSRRVRGVFMLGAWLAEHGYLLRQERSNTSRKQVLNYLLEQYGYGDRQLPARMIKRILREGLNQLPDLLVKNFYAGLERAIPLATMQLNTTERFVPEQTRVFLPGGHRGNLIVNLAGREPQGSVSLDEKEALLEQITGQLRQIVDPETGEPLFAALYRAEEIYTGPFTAQAPDLTGDYYASQWSVVSDLPGLNRRPWRYFLTGEKWFGDHSHQGIYIFSGPAFNPAAQGVQASLLDIPATLLYLYGVPLPDDFDGRPLVEFFQPEFSASHPLEYQAGDERSPLLMSAAGDSEGLQAELIERLKALGYLE